MGKRDRKAKHLEITLGIAGLAYLAILLIAAILCVRFLLTAFVDSTEPGAAAPYNVATFDFSKVPNNR